MFFSFLSDAKSVFARFNGWLRETKFHRAFVCDMRPQGRRTKSIVDRRVIVERSLLSGLCMK